MAAEPGRGRAKLDTALDSLILNRQRPSTNGQAFMSALTNSGHGWSTNNDGDVNGAITDRIAHRCRTTSPALTH
jgi:hypothetical protein